MMGAMHSNLFATWRAWVRADDAKDQRGMMGID
jgi:hypothetical protein